MDQESFFKLIEVSASGLKAERYRMDIIAQNIANAHVTRGADGLPYRRQKVIFETMLDSKHKPGGGVRVAGLEADSSPFIRIHDPGHPDADAEGMVSMPNVKLPLEMVEMITAARAYEANLSLVKTFKEMVERTLAMGR